MNTDPVGISPLQRGLITLSTMLATIMQAIDTTIANVALPHIQGSLSATQEQIAWVLTSYIVAAAIMTPPTGFLAAKFGRKRLFAVMVGGFTISSMLCGAATSLDQIVLFRLLQGICGAGLVPLSQSVLLDTWPKRHHGNAMALWGVGVMVGPIVGPSLGGWLTEVENWRWVFYINLPIGIIALAGIALCVPETDREHERRFDIFGFALLSLAVGAAQLLLDRGQSQGWFSSTEIVAEGLTFVLCLYLFIVHSMTAKRPFLEPALFRDRNLVAGLVMIFVVGIVLLATMALLPPYLQGLMGYPVVTTGFVLAPRGAGTMVSMLIVGRLIGRVDPRIMIVTGLGLTAFSLHEMTLFNMDVPVSMIVATGLVQGLGLGFIFVPLSTLSFSTLPQALRTEGAAMFSLLRNIGSSIGISVMVALRGYNIQVNHAELGAGLTPFNDALNDPRMLQLWNIHSTEGLVALHNEVNRQAATIAYLDDFTVMMWVTLAALPLALLLRRAPDPEPVGA